MKLDRTPENETKVNDAMEAFGAYLNHYVFEKNANLTFDAIELKEELIKFCKETLHINLFDQRGTYPCPN